MHTKAAILAASCRLTCVVVCAGENSSPPEQTFRFIQDCLAGGNATPIAALLLSGGSALHWNPPCIPPQWGE